MSYSIKINCICGKKAIKVPEKYAGKTGKCPSCGKKMAIPSMDEIKQKLNKEDHLSLEPNTSSKALQYVSTSLVIVVLIAIAILLFPRKEEDRSLAINQPTAAIGITADDLKALENIPENTTQALSQKIQTFETILEDKLGEDVIEGYKAYYKKKAELQAQEAYKALEAQKNNDVSYFHALNKLAATYPDTLFVAKTVNKERDSVIAKIKENIKQQQELLQKDLTDKHYSKAIEKAFTFLALYSTQSSEELATDLNPIKNLGLHAISTFGKKYDVVSDIADKETEKEQLQVLKQDINNFIATYRNYMVRWEFHDALKEIRAMYDKAQIFTAKYPEDEDIKKLIQMQEEAAVLSKVMSRAVTGAKENVGQAKIFILKDRTIVDGVIKSYKNGKWLLKDNKTKEIKEVALNQLKAVDYLSLASYQGSQDPELHKGVAFLRRIGNSPLAAKRAAENAIRYGIPEEQMQGLISWADGALEDQESSQQKRNEERLAKIQGIEQGKEEKRLHKIRRRARYLIDILVDDYKKGNNLRVLQYLKKLKVEIPRQELMKESSKLEKREGEDLVDICDTVYHFCEQCKHSGKLICPTCNGDKFLTKKVRIKGAIVSEKTKICPTCRGRGNIDCPWCEKKLKNRDYRLIYEYYDDF